MKNYIGPHQVITGAEALELALGTPLDLWIAAPGETEEERAARLDAARDILADDPELYERAVRLIAELVETRALSLPNVVQLRPQTRHTGIEGAAA